MVNTEYINHVLNTQNEINTMMLTKEYINGKFGVFGKSNNKYIDISSKYIVKKINRND